jgi:putative tryptophan/tyrosine transport system substrate-binding protein
MRRRAFIAGIGAGALLPLAAPAQQSKMPTVGVLVVGAPSSDRFWQLFQQSMRDLGYLDGRNIRYLFRSDGGQATRLPVLARELVRSDPELIVTWFTPAATAAKQASETIPIIMAAAGDPLATGLVKSLAHPGGNITGTAAMAADLAGKCVELMRDMLPSVHRLATLANAPDPFSKPFLEKIRSAGQTTGAAIETVWVHSPEELDGAFIALMKARPDALIVQPSLPIKRVAELALSYRIPAASPFRPFAEDGGLLSYWFDEDAVYRQTASMVDKILKGANPGDLPVEQPSKFELVVNLKTAKALGLAIAPTFLARADEIIQ